MTRGPKPKPTALKKLQGNPGKRSLKGKSEPRPPVTRAPAPGLLAGAGAGTLATGFLDKYRPALQSLGLLTDIDDPAFELAARHYALAVTAYDMVKAEGLTVIDDHNEKRKHPLIQVFRDQSQAFKAYAVEFGMTASSRVRLRIDEAEQLSLMERQLEQEIFGKDVHILQDDNADD